MQGGASVFAPREFEEAPPLDGTPAYLVLDGQQRLTSLYQAYLGVGSHRFFLNLKDLLNDREDVDEAVEVYPASRAKRWESIEAQAADLMLPLARLRSFSEWQQDVMDALEGRNQDLKKLSRMLIELEKEFVKPVEKYQFPVTTLSEGTPAEAVCTIFETLNRTGVKLSVFELITARAFAEEVRLRDMWTTAVAEHPVLTDFEVDPYYVLQVIALMERGSPKRSVVLALPVEKIVENWANAVGGLDRALRLLRDECGVLVPKWLPYATMLIPMAAVWKTVVAHPGPAVGARRAKVKRWFWCSVFTGAYENTPNTTAERDFQEIVAWLEDGTPGPEAVRRFSFVPERWRDVTYRQRALYRASIALLMRNHPGDFHSGKPLTKQSIEEEGVDDHHIFPRNYLKGAVSADVIDSVLNHTLIDRKTNMRIGAKPPSKYLAEMEEELGDDLHRILDSHRLPKDHDGSLFQDRFEDFLAWRVEQLTQELAEVTGAVLDEHSVLWSPSQGPEAESETDESVEGPRGAGSVLSDDVAAFVTARTSTPERRRRLQDFLEQVVSWPGAEAGVGRSNQTKDGWAYSVNLSRLGASGSFLYAYASSLKVVFRLEHEDAAGIEPVELRDIFKADARYRVRASLIDDAGFRACLKLANRAYDKTFAKPGKLTDRSNG